MNRLSVEQFKAAEKLPLVVVLDNIRSLHNIGSVFRTADAFLLERIVLCGITACPPHPEMHKTALGAEFTVDWSYVNSTLEAVNNLRNEGYTVFSIEQAERSTMLDKLQLEPGKRYAIVMGNEVKGVQQEVIDASDGCIEIPQYGTKHSLNVSVTAGIVIWDISNKLRVTSYKLQATSYEWFLRKYWCEQIIESVLTVGAEYQHLNRRKTLHIIYS